MTQNDKILLSLISDIVCGNCGKQLPYYDIDWTAIASLSSKHGIDAIVIDGLQQYLSVHPTYKPFANETKQQKCQRMQWFGRAITAEENYAKHEKAIADLAHIYAQHGIKTMILKGYGLSLNYPVPSHRPMGDLDLYTFGKDRDADYLITQLYNIKVDSRHEHHTVFRFEDILVENHYDFINTKAHRDAALIEEKLKSLANHKFKKINILDRVEVYLPSANFNAIFLMRHMGQHFAGEHLNLRQLLDWGFFVRANSQDVDWTTTTGFMKEIGLYVFFNQINAICVDYLGFEPNLFPPIERNTELENRIFADTLHSEFAQSKPESGLVPILVFKFHRWWHNRWKHKLVYSDNLFLTFSTLLYSHLIRIRSIKD